MGRKREERYVNIILETYQLLYEASEPKLDFKNLIETTKNYRDKNTNEPITLDHHLSVEEMHRLGYVIDVPYEDHLIEKKVSAKILSEQINKYKLKKNEADKLRAQVYLGCAPSFKHDDIDQNDEW